MFPHAVTVKQTVTTLIYFLKSPCSSHHFHISSIENLKEWLKNNNNNSKSHISYFVIFFVSLFCLFFSLTISFAFFLPMCWGGWHIWNLLVARYVLLMFLIGYFPDFMWYWKLAFRIFHPSLDPLDCLRLFHTLNGSINSNCLLSVLSLILSRKKNCVSPQITFTCAEI